MFMISRHSGPPRERRALAAYVKLMRCADTLEARLKRQLAEAGMTLPQLAVLEALLHLGPLTPTELSRKTLRSGGSVTSVIDTLVRKSLVARERGSADRRVCTVQLTPAGRKLIRGVFPRHAAEITAAFGTLTASEQEQLGKLCRKLGLASAGPDPGGS